MESVDFDLGGWNYSFVCHQFDCDQAGQQERRRVIISSVRIHIQKLTFVCRECGTKEQAVVDTSNTSISSSEGVSPDNKKYQEEAVVDTLSTN
jgi:hypothetical protein